MPDVVRPWKRPKLDPKSKTYIADVCGVIEVALDVSREPKERVAAAVMLWDLQIDGLREQQRAFRNSLGMMNECVQGFAIGFTNAIKSDDNAIQAMRKSIDQVESLLEPEKGD